MLSIYSYTQQGITNRARGCCTKPLFISKSNTRRINTNTKKVSFRLAKLWKQRKLKGFFNRCPCCSLEFGDSSPFIQRANPSFTQSIDKTKNSFAYPIKENLYCFITYYCPKQPEYVSNNGVLFAFHCSAKK